MNGFLRLASCVPALRVGDPSFNAARILELYRRAEEEGAAIAVFPELSVTGYTCGDLFENRILLAAAERELLALARATEGRRALLVCGVGATCWIEVRVDSLLAVLVRELVL